MRLNKIFLVWVLCLVLFQNTVFGELVPVKQWTKQWGMTGDDIGDGIAIDSTDNIYITGISSGVVGNEGYFSTNSGDTFLSKYNSTGINQWYKQFGTINFDAGTDIAIDDLDNIYITWSTQLENNIWNSSDNNFITKYSNTGTQQWTKQYGTTHLDISSGIDNDNTGNIYVTGSTWCGINGQPQEVGSFDIYLTKYNSIGNKQWIKLYGTKSHDYGNDVAIDFTGNIYILGSTLVVNKPITEWLDENDILLIKYDCFGYKEWIKKFGTENDDSGCAIAIDSSRNIYVTGYTGGNLDSNINRGGDDIFLTKFDSKGTRQWTKQFGSSGNDCGNGIAIDWLGNIYITGKTEGKLDGNTSFGGTDIFLAKYDNSGNRKWIIQYGTAGDESGREVAIFDNLIDIKSNVYVTGSTNGRLDGNLNYGGYDVFLTKFVFDNKRIDGKSYLLPLDFKQK